MNGGSFLRILQRSQICKLREMSRLERVSLKVSGVT